MIEQSMKENKNNKLIHLEVMRIIAIFFVVFNHTGKSGFFLFSQYGTKTPQFWIYLFVSIFCKFSVPLFLAISGAIMLNREDEPISVIFRKRIVKILICLVIFSVIYYVKFYSGTEAYGVKNFLWLFYSNGIGYHLYYLYLYIAYLISLPFLRAMVQNLKNKHFWFMIGSSLFLFSIVPTVEFILNGWFQTHMAENIKLGWLASTTVLYPCLGYFLEHKIDVKKQRKMIGIFAVANMLCISLSCYLTFIQGQITGEITEATSQGFHGTFVLINCIFVFLTVKYICANVRIPHLIERIIYSIGSCTFGVYLLHPLIKDLAVMKKILRFMFSHGINRMISVFIYCFLVLLVCYAITVILKKIPIIKKFI